MSNEPTCKRQKTDEPPTPSETSATDDSILLRDPGQILTWNVNGLAPRSKSPSHVNQFRQLIQTCSAPAVICIQEARLKCNGRNRGAPLPSEVDAAEPMLRACGHEYESLWSLADGRNAGTLTLLHHDLFPTNDTPKRRELIEKNSAFSVSSAIELLVEAYDLADDAQMQKMIRDSNATANATKTYPKKQGQASVASFFIARPKPSTAPTNNGDSNEGKKHHSEGRIQFFRFPNIDLLHTYVPNNGSRTDTFERRRKFDQEIRRLLRMRLEILKKAGKEMKPMLWVGDLNVARSHLDGTHYTINESTGAVKEFWTDESKFLVKKGTPQNRDSIAVADVGMPGFTQNERLRFEETIEQAKLVDVWRHLHPNGVTSLTCPLIPNGRGGSNEVNKWEKAEYTWRGAASISGAFSARYQGKGQRIDYFLLSDFALQFVQSCDILGYGEYREGFFCGSDHCASLLVLKRLTKTTSSDGSEE